jgi:glucosamine--fructose-6-phosphate aminotransferase (isomerizing)
MAPYSHFAALRTRRTLRERAQYVVGGDPSEVTALEAVIKGREAGYVGIDGMGIEQFIHGPMICIEPEDMLILISVDGPR